MSKNLFKLLIISTLSISMFLSCKTKDTTPQTCLASSITNDKGNVLQSLTYDANNRLIKDASDSADVTFDFVYNAQSLVDNIVVSGKTSAGTYAYTVAYTYDASGVLQKTVVSKGNTAYQSSVFTYSGTQVSKITTTDAHKSVTTTRFEYSGENISKVYHQIDTDKEYLYYQSSSFDTMPNFYPPIYKSLALGLIGLIDSYYFINKNNALSEKYFDESGALAYSQDNVYEYNSSLQPTKLTKSVSNNGAKSTSVNLVVYLCK